MEGSLAPITNNPRDVTQLCSKCQSMLRITKRNTIQQVTMMLFTVRNKSGRGQRTTTGIRCREKELAGDDG